MDGGLEWIVDVLDCDPRGLAGPEGESTLRGLFETLIERLDLHPVAAPTWHLFPGEGGVTGLVALTESHLACHSYPEAGYLSLNLYTCKARPEPPWERLLHQHLGPCRVEVRRVVRGSHAFRSKPALQEPQV